MPFRDAYTAPERTDCVFYACETTGDFALTYVSPAIQTLFGYPVDFCTRTGSFWIDRLHPDDKERVFSELGKLFQVGNHVHCYRFMHRDGHFLPVRDELVVIVDPDGGAKELVGKMQIMSGLPDFKTIQTLPSGEK